MADERGAGRGSEGQTFLVGPTLYLRGIEEGDARTVCSWHPNPFPLPPDVALERLRKEVPSDGEDNHEFRLVACRKSDDRPVGSVTYGVEGWRIGWTKVHADPALTEERRAAIRAELVGLIVPYLVMERDLMTVELIAEGNEPAIEAAATEVGMRRAYRLRQALQVGGQRRDLVGYEALHPAWVSRLGMPPTAEEGPVQREVRVPAPRTFPDAGDTPPEGAVIVGERVYLRAVRTEDMDLLARWSRQETETFFDNGRPIRSPIAAAHFHRKLAEANPPNWIRFAICLRENDELIGFNGIANIDWVHQAAETETEIPRPEYRGSGYGTEAKHLLLAYAFERLGLHMVYSYVWEPNTRSAAALRRQGYRDAGRLSWSGLKDGEFVGSLLFDLLAEEWQAARR
ncbi:MAG TPA: GNAT family protein [Thermomicrobiales bacterium]